MSLKSTNKTDTNKYEVVVEIEGKIFNDEVNRIYRKEVKTINIPGFRKGKAPRAIIEKMYGEEVFYDDAIKNLYPSALGNAIEEAGLDVVGVDNVEVEEANAKTGLRFKATVFVKPEEVEINDYEGIPVTVKSTEVTEEMINSEIDKVRDRNSRMVTIEDRPAQNGDTVVIDFEGFVDGEAFEGGKAENFNLVLGSGQFIPGFEEQIEGHSTNEEFSINVTFPEDYQADNLKGKESEFKIRLHEIKEKELPEVDDEFVKDVSDKETLEEYKEELKAEIAKRLQEESDRGVEDQLVDKLCELLQAEVPEIMYENKANDMLNEFGMRLRSQGMDLDEYMKYFGMTKESMLETYRPQAEKRVKVRLALEKIAEKQGFTEVSEEELNAEYEKLADSYKVEVEEAKKYVAEDALKEDIAVEKAMNFVKESAVKS